MLLGKKYGNVCAWVPWLLHCKRWRWTRTGVGIGLGETGRELGIESVSNTGVRVRVDLRMMGI